MTAKNKTLFTYSLGAATAASTFAMASVARAQETTTAIEQPVTPAVPSAAEGLGFAAPWLLAGAVVLPLLWFMMRLTPPQPAQVKFPGTRLLRDLVPKEKTPASLPWWHKMIRVGAAALAIAALSGPLLNPDEPINGEGPLLLVVDNDWAAARYWDARRAEIDTLINRAERDGRGVMILATAPPADGDAVRVSATLSAADARAAVADLAPVPWPADRAAALAALEAQAADLPRAASVVWLSNGIDGAGTASFAETLQSFGTLTVREDRAEQAPRLLLPPQLNEGTMSVTVRRADSSAPDIVGVIASDSAARPVERHEIRFAAGQDEATVTFDLPDEILRQLVRVDIEGDNSAGATVLLDGQWRHRPVGMVTNGPSANLQPLISEYSYIAAALEPYADLRRGDVDTLLQSELAVMVLADSAALDEDTRRRVDEWVREGGTVLRFAGPRLALAEDELLPVDLRTDMGARTTGGAMTWGAPARIAPFDRTSPFYGIALPDDVVIERQVLAETAGGDIADRIWARLEDGTPLVTAERRGEGMIVLVHTSANTQWSNLVLSGVFVEMMRAVVNESAGVRGTPDAQGTLPPWKTLDAQGRLQDAAPTVRGLTAEAIRAGLVGPATPPGIYGGEAGRRAHNLGAAVTSIDPLGELPAAAHRATYVDRDQRDFTGILLGGAMGLMLLDLLLVLGNRRSTGLRPQPARRPQP